jgi:hypothetical protein
MAIDVYLSAGRPANQAQENFLQAVEHFLRQNDLNPRTPGRTHVANKQPLKAVEQCMRTCKAIVVVAYERLYAPLAKERRDAPDKLEWKDAIVTTVWNQVEGAIAYTLGLPVLIIAQQGLRVEAMLEDKYDWSVQWVEIDSKSLLTPSFTSVFNDWRNEIDAVATARAAQGSVAAVPPPAPVAAPMNPGDRTIGQLLKDLKPGQAWKVGLALFGLVSALVTYSYKQGVRDGAARAPSPSAASSVRSP